MITLTSPTKAVFSGSWLEPSSLRKLKEDLTYRNHRVEFQHRKLKNSPYAMNKMGQEAWTEAVADLKSKIKGCLLFTDDDGTTWTYPGIAEKLALSQGDSVSVAFEYPELKLLPWNKEPFPMRPYQEKAVEALLSKKHAAVQLPTGAGKSLIIFNLIRRCGLKTVVMCPSRSIARQLFDEALSVFGTSKVGLFGDGKKVFDKLITIAIDDSLNNVEKDTPAYQALSSADVFIVDESHLVAASTLQNVCTGLMGNAPYRWFLSATQFRTDGLDIVLEGLTGPVVMDVSVRELVESGYLSKLRFTMVRVESDSRYYSKDVLRMTKAHMYYNDNLLDVAADMINRFVLDGRPTLVLIDEVEQFAAILHRLNVPAQFAHGPLTKDNKDKVPAPYQKSEPSKLVADFNAGKCMLLFGTSCVSIGTDIRPTQVLMRIKGGASGIEVQQDVGRGTRLVPGKKVCDVIDFDVVNVDDVHRHALDRKDIYESYDLGPVRYL